jgi:FtsP/CotA-like multicopper oxidase with cupredoxin domain
MKKLCVAVLATIALSSCGSSSSSDNTVAETSTTAATETSKTFEHTITVGKNTGPNVVIEVLQGQEVTLNVVNPSSHDEVHLHGYDLTTGAIEKDEIAIMTFIATKTGDFEIESHETEDLISVLRVTAP